MIPTFKVIKYEGWIPSSIAIPVIDRAPISFYTENFVSRHDVMNLIAIFTNLKYKTFFDCKTESADAVSKRVLKTRCTI